MTRIFVCARCWTPGLVELPDGPPPSETKSGRPVGECPACNAWSEMEFSVPISRGRDPVDLSLDFAMRWDQRSVEPDDDDDRLMVHHGSLGVIPLEPSPNQERLPPC